MKKPSGRENTMRTLLQVVTVFAILTTVLISSGCDEGTDFFTGDDDDVLYMAIGASDALGVGAIPENEGYVFRIEDSLDEELEDDVELCGFCLVALPASELNQIKELLEESLDIGVDPDVVTILVGANDIIAGVEPDDFESDLEEVLNEIFDESSDAVIVIGNVPDLTQLPRFMDDPSDDVTPERIAAFNEAIQRQAQAFNILPVVDLFSVMITDDFLADDGFHPSDEGHELVAELFLDVLLPKLGVSPSPVPSESPSPTSSPAPSVSPSPSSSVAPSPSPATSSSPSPSSSPLATPSPSP